MKIYILSNQLSDWKDKYKKLEKAMFDLNEQNTQMQKRLFRAERELLIGSVKQSDKLHAISNNEGLLVKPLSTQLWLKGTETPAHFITPTQNSIMRNRGKDIKAKEMEVEVQIQQGKYLVDV